MEFKDRVDKARAEKPLTNAEKAELESLSAHLEEGLLQEERQKSIEHLASIWNQVTDAMAELNPKPDLTVVNSDGMLQLEGALQELHRKNRTKGPPSNRLLRRHDKISDYIIEANPQPAWDMVHEMLLPGIIDESTRGFISKSMFLGADSTIYTGAEFATFHRGVAVPVGQLEVQPGYDFYNATLSWRKPPLPGEKDDQFGEMCHASIEQGLANLVARHNLEI